MNANLSARISILSRELAELMSIHEDDRTDEEIDKIDDLEAEIADLEEELEEMEEDRHTKGQFL